MIKPSIDSIKSQNAYLKSIADSCNNEEYVKEETDAGFSYLVNRAIWIEHEHKPNLKEIQAAFADGEDRKDRIYKLLLRLDPASLGNVAGYLGSLDEKEGKEPGSKSSVPKDLKMTDGVLDPETTKETLQNFVEELRWRGTMHDIMPGTEELLNKEIVTGYIGFDPTADSLHVGSLLQIMVLRLLQKHHHQVIIRLHISK
jgi:hypothetical protein